MKFSSLNRLALGQSEDNKSFSDKLLQSTLGSFLKSNIQLQRFYKPDLKSGKYQLKEIEYQDTIDGQTWMPRSRVQYTYEKNLVTKSLYQEYRQNNQEWINSFQFLYVYHAGNLAKKTTNQYWDNEKKAWINQHLTLYDYDANQRMKTVIHKIWNANPDGWRNSYKEAYRYDNTGLLSELGKFSFREETWVADSRHLYRYGNNNNLSSETIQQKQADTNRWVNFFRHCYSYNSNNQRTKEIYQNWLYESARWLNNTQTIYIYDRKTGKLIGHRFQQWNKATEGWYNETQYLYAYYPENFLKEFLIQSWSDQTNNWFDAHRSRYFYDGRGRILEDFFENKFDEWTIEYAEFYSYDKNGNLRIVLTRHGEEGAAPLIDTHKTLYSYQKLNPAIDEPNPERQKF